MISKDLTGEDAEDRELWRSRIPLEERILYFMKVIIKIFYKVCRPVIKDLLLGQKVCIRGYEEFENLGVKYI